jgi:hypothetical protein
VVSMFPSAAWWNAEDDQRRRSHRARRRQRADGAAQRWPAGARQCDLNPEEKVGAHYDTVPGTPGADDNASAVAVMLELARRLRETSLSAPVRLVAFTLEEPPASMTRHRGSRVFVRACKSAGHFVAAALVLEMVGYTSRCRQHPSVKRYEERLDR